MEEPIIARKTRGRNRGKNSHKDTVNAIDKEKNIDSKNLSKDLGTNGYPNHESSRFMTMTQISLQRKQMI